MAPPRSPPELNDDAVREILSYLAPHDPACLVRAYLVWPQILSDEAFQHRYRRFHRNPPLLGFFHDVCGYKDFPRFVPTTAAEASPFLPTALARGALAFDCRHGRVLLQPDDGLSFVVWDPITGDQVKLPSHGIPYQRCSASVLCARDGCDHLHCAGGPFIVVFVCSDVNEGRRACVFSSEAGAWSAPAFHLSPSSEPASSLDVEPGRGALVGDKIFFMLSPGNNIMMYDLGKHSLSLINPPGAYCQAPVLMGSEIGLLGLAGIKKDSELYVWYKKVEPEEAEWVQSLSIKLETLVPNYNPSSRARVIGFAEAVGAIFIRINDCVYIFELGSGKMLMKVCTDVDYDAVLPFTSFYTPGCAKIKEPLPVETN